jgi:hypothetical protein
MTVARVALGSDGERIFKAFAPLYIERSLVQVLKTSLDISFEKQHGEPPPDLYVIEFNKKSQASDIWHCLHRPKKAPILIILDPEPVAHYHNVLNMYNPRNVTGYLLKSSIPALLPEAVETICRNSYYCDPHINQIKIPKRL